MILKDELKGRKETPVQIFQNHFYETTVSVKNSSCRCPSTEFEL